MGPLCWRCAGGPGARSSKARGSRPLSRAGDGDRTWSIWPFSRPESLSTFFTGSDITRSQSAESARARGRGARRAAISTFVVISYPFLSYQRLRAGTWRDGRLEEVEAEILELGARERLREVLAALCAPQLAAQPPPTQPTPIPPSQIRRRSGLRLRPCPCAQRDAQKVQEAPGSLRSRCASGATSTARAWRARPGRRGSPFSPSAARPGAHRRSVRSRRGETRARAGARAAGGHLAAELLERLLVLGGVDAGLLLEYAEHVVDHAAARRTRRSGKQYHAG